MTAELAPRRFTLAVTAIVTLFCALEVAYAFRQPRVMDEFTNAYHANCFVHKLPYRDFQPPKTVLGYYVEMLPLAITSGNWSGMTAIRIELAILWTAVLGFAAFALRRDLRADAIVIALGMTCVMSTFAERSTEIRVDPIASMFGLLSFVALIRRRPELGGLLAAASFCATQKGIYFSVAGGVALICVAVRDRTREQLLAPVAFGAAAFAAVAAYFGFWVVMSSRHAVFGSVLFDPAVRSIAFGDLYPTIRLYWLQTLIRNPAFYAAAFAGLLLLIPRWLTRTSRAPAVIVPYVAILTGLCIWHKQPWPYFFVTLVPSLFVIIALALDELRWPRTLLVAIVALALLVPLIRIPNVLTRPETGYQHAMVDAGEQLLEPGDTYIDGTNMLYRHDQASGAFFWIDAPALEALRSRTEPELMEIIRRADATHPKLLIWNYRTSGFPPLLQQYIRSRFRWVYGSILLYAKDIEEPSFTVDFDGAYAIDAGAVIDGRAVQNIVQLKKGSHSLAGVARARLRLLPPAGVNADTGYAEPQPLFANAYSY